MGGYTHGHVWSEEEDNFVRENFGSMTYKEMANCLGITYGQVSSRAKKMGLKNYVHREWTEDEKQFLIDNYPDKLGHYCAEKLGRSFHATHKMVAKLGIKPNWSYHHISAQGYMTLRHDRNNPIAEHRLVMEQKLGRKLTSEEIVHHIDGNKLNNDPNNLVITNRSAHARLHGLERGGLNPKR